MKQVPIHLPRGVQNVERAIDRAIADTGLTVVLRGSLKKFPGCVHWHTKRGRESGTLEITYWPGEHRAWFTIQSGRKGEWIEDGMRGILRVIRRGIGKASAS
jgi:hypothetical protein